jgi:glycosyltransferase involved in cell wall biosynthesis
MISILMPICNEIEFIDESVNSIINQTFQDWELIIGFFNQNNDYLEAKKYENEKIKILDFPLIENKSNILNEMIKHTKYDWIAFIELGDILFPNKFEKQIQYINSYDIIGTLCQYLGNSNFVPTLPLNDLKDFDFYKYNPIVYSSVLLKKELCFWKEEWRGIEDYDLWLRLWKLNKKFYNIPSIEVLHRIHKQSAFNAKGNGNDVIKLLEWHQSN